MDGWSGSQFGRTTTGIQSKPEALEESRLVMTFLNITGITWVFCSFRLLSDVNASKEIPEIQR